MPQRLILLDSAECQIESLVYFPKFQDSVFEKLHEGPNFLERSATFIHQVGFPSKLNVGKYYFLKLFIFFYFIVRKTKNLQKHISHLQIKTKTATKDKHFTCSYSETLFSNYLIAVSIFSETFSIYLLKLLKHNSMTM